MILYFEIFTFLLCCSCVVIDGVKYQYKVSTVPYASSLGAHQTFSQLPNYTNRSSVSSLCLNVKSAATTKALEEESCSISDRHGEGRGVKLTANHVMGEKAFCYFQRGPTGAKAINAQN